MFKRKSAKQRLFKTEGPAAKPMQKQEAVFGLIWCLLSMTMTLMNKSLSSSFEFNAQITQVACQFFISVVLIKTASSFNAVRVSPLDITTVRLWLPLNFLFVGMVVSGFKALRLLQVPMFTLLKNLTNLLTIVGDLVFYGKKYSIGVWASLCLMIISAFFGTKTDLHFDVNGYYWMAFHCTVSAGYTLYLKRVLTRASSKGMTDISKVYYNHMLGLPLLITMSILFGEVRSLPDQESIYDPNFIFVLILSGVLGFLLCFMAMRFMSITTPTVFAMTGALNKIPMAVLGWIFFQAETNIQNVLSVTIGLISGALFVQAKGT